MHAESSPDWDRLRPILEAALKLEGRERSAFLDEVCVGDEPLRREVDSLLDTEHEGADILEGLIARAAGELAAESSEDAELIGATVHHYKILSRLGAGGFGVVYKAEDTRLNRFVALKFLKAGLDARSVERFLREARAASGLSHSGICTVYDVGAFEGAPYIAMEFIEGPTLKARIAEGALSIEEIVDAAIALSDALHAAHAKDIVHRDVKPANICLIEGGGLKILDFGLAKPIGAAGGESVSMRGEIIGTPHYMSPEQALGLEIDRRTDIFSLGAVVYEMIAGQPPFNGTTTTQIIDRIAHSEPSPLAGIRADTPPALDRIVARCLDKDRTQRYESAQDVAADLRVLQQKLATERLGLKERGSRRLFLLASASGLTLLAATGLRVWRAGGALRGPSDGLQFIDLSTDSARQVVVDREPGQFLGHTATLLLNDGRTILAVYPRGKGAGAIVMKRSTDAGLTWSGRFSTPPNWATSQEVPTLFRAIDPAGKERLLLFSGHYPIRMSVSDDDGETWTPLAPIGDFGGLVAMASVERLLNGDYMALFHDDRRFFTATNQNTGGPLFTLYKTLSRDGGLTWGPPSAIASDPRLNLCEPGLIRSPDGKQIALLLRENHHYDRSYVIFSNDEGVSWSQPRQLAAALTGDRHVPRYDRSGQLVVSFRDRLPGATIGDWVLWVGSYEDIVDGAEGRYRVRLMDSHAPDDAGYAGVEVLPDNTLVMTSYGHWVLREAPFIVSVRLKVAELQTMASQPAAAR